MAVVAFAINVFVAVAIKIIMLKKYIISMIKSIYNPLHIITFHNKEDYEAAYSKYPHSYIKYAIKNICKKKNDIIYINKAPSPEDIVWKIWNLAKNIDISKVNLKILE